MATRPTNDLLVWANTDVNLPNLAGPNKTEPSADLVAKGWDFKQKPSADEFNYILNNLGEHIAYLEGDLTYTFTGDVTGTVNTSGSEDATINLQVVDNSHSHTSANISDATSANNADKIVKRGASGEISVGHVTVNKVSNESTILFPATTNDAGFITHSETNDVARMKFSISDNSDTSDAFQFGNTEGGSFVPKFTIYGDGTVDSKGNITAPSFIGPLNGNANTATNATQHINTQGGVHGAVSVNSPGNLMMRDGNGDVAARYFVGDLNGNANTATKWQTARTLTLTGSVTGSVSVDGSGNVSMTTSVSSSSGVAILTGTVANGGTIPLPSGFSEAQCKWMVSIDNSNSNGTGWDIDNAIVANHISHRCYTTGRVVTANTTVRDEAGFKTYDATANYIIIGVK